jgi:hypothetical protein
MIVNIQICNNKQQYKKSKNWQMWRLIVRYFNIWYYNIVNYQFYQFYVF